MEYVTVKDLAKKWGYSEGTIRKWCRAGMLKTTIGAERVSGHWQIPSTVECPKKIKTK